MTIIIICLTSFFFSCSARDFQVRGKTCLGMILTKPRTSGSLMGSSSIRDDSSTMVGADAWEVSFTKTDTFSGSSNCSAATLLDCRSEHQSKAFKWVMKIFPSRVWPGCDKQNNGNKYIYKKIIIYIKGAKGQVCCEKKNHYAGVSLSSFSATTAIIWIRKSTFVIQISNGLQFPWWKLKQSPHIQACHEYFSVNSACNTQ